MKKILLLLFLLTNLYSENISSEDINIAMKFIGLDRIPEIIQQPKYIEDETNKITAVFSKNNFIIKGIYLKDKIFMYDLNLKLDHTPECSKIEQFIKTGYLVHELTHYKQDVDNEVFKDQKEYFISHKERGAFENQILFYIENHEDKNEEFLSCYKMSSKKWFLSYLNVNKDTHTIFNEYSSQYKILEEFNEDKYRDEFKVIDNYLQFKDDIKLSVLNG